MTRKAMCLLTVAAAMLITGCLQPQNAASGRTGRSRRKSKRSELAAISRPPVADLPVPKGFRLNESRSRTFAEAGSRYVDHVYEGNADKYTISRFYKRHMPIYRWVLTTDMLVQGKIILDFEKDNERSRIIIAQGNVIVPSRVLAQVWTRSKTVVTASR